MSRIKIGKSRKHARLTQGFGVSATDIYEAEQELRQTDVFRYQDTAITAHWFCQKTASSAVVLPLEKLAHYHKDYSWNRYGVNFFVRVFFEHETARANFKIKCDFDQLDDIAAQIQKRCPHAAMRRASEPDYDPDYDPEFDLEDFEPDSW